MSLSNHAIVSGLKHAAEHLGFKAVRGTDYYLAHPETVCVLNLQRSSFGPQYYLNAGVFLTRFSEVQQPKEHKCHIRWRLSSCIPPEELPFFNEALDLETPLSDQSRTERIHKSARTYGFEILAQCSSEEASLDAAKRIGARVAQVALLSREI